MKHLELVHLCSLSRFGLDMLKCQKEALCRKCSDKVRGIEGGSRVLMKLLNEPARVAQELHTTLAKAAILLFNTNIRSDNAPRLDREHSFLQALQKPIPQSFAPQPPSTSTRSQISVHPQTSRKRHLHQDFGWEILTLCLS